MIPYGMHSISSEDVQSVVDVLTSSFLTQGPVVPKFEEAVAEYTGAKFSIATNSATSALHIACMALGLGPSDSLWTTPVSFVASANCGLYCGANIDFVDIDPSTYNISVDALSKKLREAKKNNNLPKIVVAVHLAGQSCDMERIKELSQLYEFYVIEDASHAIGGLYKNQPIGSCLYSDITIFSFHPVKIITTAEGGMAVTNSLDLSKKMNLIRSHGITRDGSEMLYAADGPWYYEQIELGYNYRLSDVHAALGLSQLSRIEQFVEKRHNIASFYNKSLSDLPILLPTQDQRCYSSYHLYIIRLKLADLNCSHQEIFQSLRLAGIGVNLHYIPIYRHPFYRKSAYDFQSFPQSEKYYAEAISLPIFPDLSDTELQYVVETIKNLIK